MPHIICANSPILIFESYCKKMEIDGKDIFAKISNIPLKLKVASTEKSQSVGYMNSNRPPSKNRGILFIYEKPTLLSFWMKSVKFPLDIIFFDSNMNYINHHTMDITNEINNNRIPKYSSSKPAQFAVELSAGWCKKNMTQNCTISF